jgi:hypothetical protein
MAALKSNEIPRILIGGTSYISIQGTLDFLAKRRTLMLEQVCVRGLPLGDTEFLRGQLFELEIIKHAIQSPPQVS